MAGFYAAQLAHREHRTLGGETFSGAGLAQQGA